MFKNLLTSMALLAVTGSAFAITTATSATPAIPKTPSSGPIVIKAKPVTTVKAKRAKSHAKKVKTTKTSN